MTATSKSASRLLALRSTRCHPRRLLFTTISSHHNQSNNVARTVNLPRYLSTTIPQSQSSSQPNTANPNPNAPKAAPSSTYYTLFPQTLPDGPPPTGPFHIDPRSLRSEFLKRQQSTHPDLFPPSQRKSAELASSQLNKAYTTLLSPLLRAEYILTLRGYIDPSTDETSRLEDKELLMEILEANETLESARSEEELEGLKEVSRERVEEGVKVIGEAFGRDELEVVKGEVVRLRYWMNVGESLRHWEPGKGVVLQH
ncbi:hypothetical protein TWF694_008474 [Orbilia ellipsospora]|uniref:Co-chaperone HscB C-terminal oligomerisation domain-containing protein n=1 Tax=Orbilia ellipsospora TaxID=2528407 RepID=A0AAV9XGS4_9PEZI